MKNTCCLKLLHEICFLIENNKFFSLEILFRSFIELFSTIKHGFTALSKNREEYINELRKDAVKILKNLKEINKRYEEDCLEKYITKSEMDLAKKENLESMKNTISLFFAEESKNITEEKEEENLNEIISALKKKYLKDYTIDNYVIKALKNNRYLLAWTKGKYISSIYSRLSNYAHSNLFAIQDKNIKDGIPAINCHTDLMEPTIALIYACLVEINDDFNDFIKTII